MPWPGGHEVRRRKEHFHRHRQARGQRARSLGLQTLPHRHKNFRTPPKLSKCNAPPAMRIRSRPSPPALIQRLANLLALHAMAACTSVTTAEKLMPAKCVACHADEVKALASSIHGQAAKSGDPDAPKCVSCHGRHPRGESLQRSGLHHCPQEHGRYLRQVPQRCRVFVAAQNSGGASRRFLQAERSRPRGRGRQGSGNLFQLPRHARYLSRHRCAIQRQPLESAGNLRAMPQRNRARVQRERRTDWQSRKVCAMRRFASIVTAST